MKRGAYSMPQSVLYGLVLGQDGCGMVSQQGAVCARGGVSLWFLRAGVPHVFASKRYHACIPSQCVQTGFSSMDKQHVDYQQYHDLVGQVITKVQQSGFQPDVVLGVARGGLFLADGLSRALKVPMAVVVASSYQDAGGTVQGPLRVSASMASLDPVRGKVLLVDDLADSGQTLLALREHLERTLEGLQELKTAVIWVKPHSVIEPDYSALHLQNDVWIVQPFEIRDF